MELKNCFNLSVEVSAKCSLCEVEEPAANGVNAAQFKVVLHQFAKREIGGGLKCAKLNANNEDAIFKLYKA